MVNPAFLVPPLSFVGWGAATGVDIRLVHDYEEKSLCVDAGEYTDLTPALRDDRGDLVNDNVVNGTDLAFLLGAWGSCGYYRFAGMAQGSGNGGTTPAEVVENLGLGSIAELVEYLESLGVEAMFAWLELVFGDGE